MVLGASDFTLTELLRQFVARQRLVHQVIQEVRPWILSGQRGQTSGLSKKILRDTSRGTWGEHDKWQFWMHGPGCRMVNTRTGEPLNWDPSELRRFDIDWFAKWLAWYGGQLGLESHVSKLCQEICFQYPQYPDNVLRERLKVLIELGLVDETPYSSQKYTLTKCSLGSKHKGVH